MANERIDVQFGAKLAELLTGFAEARTIVQEGVEDMRAHIERFNSAVSAVRNVFVGFTAALAGGEAFEQLIEKTAETGVQLELLHAKTGLAVEELSRLEYAAQLSHTSIEALDVGLKRLARGMQEATTSSTSPAAQAFRAIGVSVADAAGHLRPMGDVLGDIADRFKTYEDGAAKSALAQNLFGRSGSDLIPLLDQGRQGIAALGAEADKLGVTMTQEGVDRAVDYEDAMKRLAAAGRGFAQSIALQIMPALTAIADTFTGVASDEENTITVTDVLGGVFRALAAAIIGVQFVFETLWDTGSLILHGLANLVVAVGRTLNDALHGRFDAIAQDWRDSLNSMSQDTDAIQKHWLDSINAGHDQLSKLFGFGSDEPPPVRAPKGGGTKPPPTINGTPLLAQYQAEWDAIRQQQGVFAGDMTQKELEFWQSKLATAQRGSQEYVAILHKVVELEQKVAQDAYEAHLEQLKAREEADKADAAKIVADREAELAFVRQSYAEESKQVQTALKALAEARAALVKQDRDSYIARLEAVQAYALAAIEILQGELATEQQLGTINAQDAAKRAQALADSEYEIRRKAIEDEMALADGDVAKQREIEAKLVALNIDYAKKTAAIQQALTLGIRDQWNGVFAAVTDAVNQTTSAIIAGTMSMRDGIRNILRSVALDFIAHEFSLVKAHAAAELAKREITAASVAERVAVEAAGIAETVALTIAGAVKAIAVFAWKAAAATFASIAEIPLVGPFLAIPAALGAAAFVLGFGAKAASASGGYDIPAGVNPMTQLHQEEMVLPADLANKIRGMTNAGGNTVHIHVQTLDAQSFRQYALKNKEAIADAWVEAANSGRIEPKKVRRV